MSVSAVGLAWAGGVARGRGRHVIWAERVWLSWYVGDSSAQGSALHAAGATLSAATFGTAKRQAVWRAAGRVMNACGGRVGGMSGLACAIVWLGCASGQKSRGGDAGGPLPPGAEAVSLLGDTLYPLPLPPGTRQQYEQRLAEARSAWEANPTDADATIWLGRRTAYVGRYQDAISIYTAGIARHPSDARLLRHRGHRYITVRQFDRAIADLRHAATLEVIS